MSIFAEPASDNDVEEDISYDATIAGQSLYKRTTYITYYYGMMEVAGRSLFYEEPAFNGSLFVGPKNIFDVEEEEEAFDGSLFIGERNLFDLETPRQQGIAELCAGKVSGMLLRTESGGKALHRRFTL